MAKTVQCRPPMIAGFVLALSASLLAGLPAAHSTPVQNELLIAQSSVWSRLASIFFGSNPRPLGARGSVCPIAPGRLDGLQVWSDQPLFVWSSEGTQSTEVKIRERMPNETTAFWSKTVQGEVQQVSYDGTPLQPGAYYQWQVDNNLNDDTLPPWDTFQVMSTAERDQIALDLTQLEADLQAQGATAEQMALQKAEYFANQKLWVDALQVLQETNSNAPEVAQERQALLDALVSRCPSAGVS